MALMIAKDYARHGNWAMAERFAARAAGHGLVSALIDVAELAVDAGHLDYAERLVGRAVKRGAAHAQNEVLSRILAMRGRWEDAESVALEGFPSAQAIGVLAQMRIATQQWDEAARLAELAAQHGNDAWLSVVAQGMADDGRHKEAYPIASREAESGNSRGGAIPQRLNGQRADATPRPNDQDPR
jgi:hypothetical protein